MHFNQQIDKGAGYDEKQDRQQDIQRRHTCTGWDIVIRNMKD